MNNQSPTVLTHIINDKLSWITQRKITQPLQQFYDQIKPSDRNFYQALKQSHTVFILECKKASPSKGLIRTDFDPVEIAKCYRNDAAAISVLTDEKYFQGSFDYLVQVRQHVTQPILCKDFIIDEYQIYLARYYQADAILLMLSVLNDEQYCQLSQLATSLKMGILTEVSTENELTRAIQLNAKVIGINNRNLRDLSISLERTRQLAPKIPDDRIIISESGIYTHQQVKQLCQYVDGFLIGSALMSQPDLTRAVHSIIFGNNKICGLTRPQDAITAYQTGAVYGGLIFVAESPRYLSPDLAHTIVNAAPLLWVGVFRNEAIDTVIAIAIKLNLAAVQLHGNEDDNYIRQLFKQLPSTCQIWQAYSIDDHLPTYWHANVTCYVFDHAHGGSGIAFNWQLLATAPASLLERTFLAGGINLANVQQAIQLGCFGLDINSGAESAPGIKDKEKISLLFNQLRDY